MVSESFLLDFLHSPSVAFDYEAQVTAVPMDPTGRRKSEGKTYPSPWSMDCVCNCTPPNFSSARNWSHKHTMLKGRLGNVGVFCFYFTPRSHVSRKRKKNTLKKIFKYPRVYVWVCAHEYNIHTDQKRGPDPLELG